MAHTYGIDVSKWQELISWDKLVEQGFIFAFIKASQADWVDSTFKSHWQGAKEAGIWRAAYHFFVQDIDPHKQAQTFIGLLQGDPGELPPIVDVEHESRWDRDIQKVVTIPIINHTSFINNLHVMLRDVEAALNRRPLIYTGSGFWNGEMSINGNFPNWAPSYQLWVANYIELTFKAETMLATENILAAISDIEQGKLQGFPSMPHSWKDWVFWQISGNKYFLDGVETLNAEKKVVSAHIDLNLFAGTPEELHAWAHLDQSVSIPKGKPDVSEIQQKADSQVELQMKLTNQQMINVYFKAFGEADYWDIIVRVGLASMADDRMAEYTGLSIDALPLSETEKDALKRALA